MKYRLSLLLAISLLMSATSRPVLAADTDRSCTIVARLTPTFEFAECLQNNGMDQGDFEQFCSTVLKSVPAVKVTFVNACPVQIRGTCEDAYERPITAYFLDSRSLEDIRKACTSSGGHWLNNGVSRVQSTPVSSRPAVFMETHLTRHSPTLSPLLLAVRQ